MPIDAELREAFFTALRLQPGKKFQTSQCSFCHEFAGFVSDGSRVGFDSSCGCSDYPDPVSWRDWSDLQYFLDAENPDSIREFITAGVEA